MCRAGTGLCYMHTPFALRATTLFFPCFITSLRTIFLLQQAEKKHRAEVVKMVENDPVLKEEINQKLRVSDEGRVDAVHAEITRALAASLVALELNCKSNIGRVAYNTVLAAAAGSG